METPLTKRFGLHYPFVSAGMAFVALPELVSAVSNVGGLGVLGATPEPACALRARIHQIRALTPKPFGVDFVHDVGAMGPFVTAAHIGVCAAERVPLVVFHLNLPDIQFVIDLSDAGIEVWFQTGDASQAAQAIALGVTGIVAQGEEAGGHNNSVVRSEDAFRAIRAVAPTNVLVLWAGGIADGPTAAAALQAGADGVWVGTRMVATHEAYAHSTYKARILDVTSSSETTFTTMFGPEYPGGRQRVLCNDVVRQFAGREATIPDSGSPAAIGRTVLFPGVGDLAVAMPKFSALVPIPDTIGDFEQMNMPAGGMSAKRVDTVEPAAEVVVSMMERARAILEAELETDTNTEA
ncbi:NAD(P)H-dependent flavin oxidoreductase [Enhygromyxa salina]|uniref:NAD(P)H-dependent flavin oxidoreductase n=1 Tax=Enhygromyxa salina TaxID=215803 RepID=UPI0015E76E49|nr:nitronate monooxygenase [Enhygromyxa salina]